MKRVFGIALIALGSVAAFTGCSKSSSGSSNSLSASVNGVNINLKTCYFGMSGGVLSIYGTNGNSTTVVYPNMVLTIGNYTAGATGTYAFQDTSLNINTWVTADLDSSSTQAALSTSGSGNIQIKTASSSSISGTFSFTADDGTKVTTGTFTATSR